MIWLLTLFFRMMSTEHDFTDSSIQHEWLENDLKSVNRSKTPWVVFTGHRPMYCSEVHSATVNGTYLMSKFLRKHIEPLLHRYK
jgi:hypothetical protein